MRSSVADQVMATSAAPRMPKTPRMVALSRISRSICFCSSPILFLPGAEHLRLRVVVDGGGGHVHEQHGEGHGVGIASPGADDEHRHADEETVDEPAPGRGAGSDGIGGDEEGAQNHAAAEQVETGEGYGFGVEHPEQAGGEQQAGEHAGGDLPRDHLAPEQEQAADEEPVAHPLPAAGTEIAPQGALADLADGLVEFQLGAHLVQGGGAGNGVPGEGVRQVTGEDGVQGLAEGELDVGEYLRRQPAGHGHRE